MLKTFEQEEQDRAAKIILESYLQFKTELYDHHKKTLKVLYEIEASLEELKVGTTMALSKLFQLEPGDHIEITGTGDYKIVKKEINNGKQG